MAMNFHTSNESLRKLLGNGITYEIPKFQRDYSWEEEDWQELWDDIQVLIDEEEEEAEHYMGYLVLQSADSKHHTVIDGQQRLTTISIIILAAIACLQKIAKTESDEKDNNLRAEQLRTTLIGYLDTETLVPQSKLTLNRNDDAFYQNYIVPLEKLPNRKLTASTRRLRNAFMWFSKKIKEHGNEDGKTTAHLINVMVDKLFVTVITVTDELNAFKVFETLNARGVRLSSSDLLKNYLFSMADSADLIKMDDWWQSIISELGDKPFPLFLRVFLNSQDKLVRKKDIFQRIKTSVKTKGEAFSLLREMDKSVSIYTALHNPLDEDWGKETRKVLNELKIFNVKQPFPLLMAGLKHLFEQESKQDNRDFLRVLKAISIISFRYNVICGLNPNIQEKVYGNIANKIADKSITNAGQIIKQLEELYPKNDIFEAAFREKEFNSNPSKNKKILRHVLFSIEKHLSGGTMYDLEDSSITIEHICPQDVGDSSWSEETEQLIHKLGNLTLLKAQDNRSVGNSAYADKISIYEQSGFKITTDIPKHYSEWNEEKIMARQEHFAGKALEIWEIQFPR